MAATNSDDLIALLRSEKENLELVNSNLLGVLEKKETEIVLRFATHRRTTSTTSWSR